MSDTATGTDTNYAILRMWGGYMFGGAEYISDQLALARQEKAPWNATYRRDDGWHTADEITNLAALDFLGVPKASRRRNTLMRHQVDVAILRDQLESKAEALRAFDSGGEGPSVQELAGLLELAARSCEAVADQLGVAMQGFPLQERGKVEPAVQERLSKVGLL